MAFEGLSRVHGFWVNFSGGVLDKDRASGRKSMKGIGKSQPLAPQPLGLTFLIHSLILLKIANETRNVFPVCRPLSA